MLILDILYTQKKDRQTRQRKQTKETGLTKQTKHIRPRSHGRLVYYYKHLLDMTRLSHNELIRNKCVLFLFVKSQHYKYDVLRLHNEVINLENAYLFFSNEPLPLLKI